MKTLKIVSWHPLIIFFLGLVFPFASAQAFDLSGTWSGVYHNPDFGYQRASAILTHAANDVSGTYSTSTGVSGNIRLIVTGTTLEGTLVQEGSCSGYFLVTGVVRGEVLTVMINGYDCSPAATNIVLLTQNEVFFEPWIVLNKVRYSDGYEEGDFWTGLNAPNPLDIQAVSVVTPNFDEFALSMDDEDNRWERTVMGFPANENPRHFPDGFYYYNIQYKDGSTATAFSVLDTEYPDHFPIIISPAHGDIIDPGSDLLVAWEPADASVDSIYASAGDQPGQGYPSSDTQFIVPGGSLGVRMEHDVWLSFQKNSPYFPCNKSLTSSIDFFTGSLLVGSWIAYGKGKSPSNETAIFFFAGLESAGVTAAAISTPPGESIPFSYDPVFRDWRVDQGLASEEEAQVRFPDGDYQFQVTFENGSTETKTVRLSGLLPEAIPHITQPQNGATVDKFEPTLNIAWDPWPNGSGEVYLEIVKIDAIPDDNGFESKVKELVWQGAFTPEATVCTVPTTFLDADSDFELSIVFASAMETAAAKATRRHIFFQTNCSFKISHTNMAFEASAGVDQVTLTAEDCLSWTAKRNDSWITITSGGNGVGNGTVDYSVSSNWRATPRTGSLTIAGKTFIVYQAAGDTPCSEGPVRIETSDFATIKEAYIMRPWTEKPYTVIISISLRISTSTVMFQSSWRAAMTVILQQTLMKRPSRER